MGRSRYVYKLAIRLVRERNDAAVAGMVILEVISGRSCRSGESGRICLKQKPFKDIFKKYFLFL